MPGIIGLIPVPYIAICLLSLELPDGTEAPLTPWPFRALGSAFGLPFPGFGERNGDSLLVCFVTPELLFGRSISFAAMELAYILRDCLFGTSSFKWH